MLWVLLTGYACLSVASPQRSRRQLSAQHCSQAIINAFTAFVQCTRMWGMSVCTTVQSAGPCSYPHNAQAHFVVPFVDCGALCVVCVCAPTCVVQEPETKESKIFLHALYHDYFYKDIERRVYAHGVQVSRGS